MKSLKRAVFIGGADRSGTTFFGALLGAHSRCVVTPESQFNVELCREYETKPWEPARVLSRLRRHKRFRIWEFDLPKELEAAHYASWPEMMGVLVEAYGRKVVGKDSEATYWIDHTPWNLDFMELLRRHYPGARFLHIVRDGRALAASHRRVWWGQDDPLSMASFWHKKLSAAFANQCRYPGEVLTVRYEDLVERTEETLRSVAEFLDLEYEERMLLVDGLSVPDYTKDQHALVGKPPQRSRVTDWQRSLSKREIEIFEAEAGTMLEILGYERIFENPRPATKYDKLAFYLRYRFKRDRRRVSRQLSKFRWRKNR